MSDDDKNWSISRLRQHHRRSIVSQLVEIGNESNRQEHAKFRSFIKNLQCLKPRGSKLHRQLINAFEERRYVALSYTWTPSEHEDPRVGRYAVENWDNGDFKFSNVRECVLKRALHYMSHAKIRFLWIDAHCIRQVTCHVDNCARHPHCLEKRDAIQAMDLVYQLSAHPVALLGRRLESEGELELLEWILSGNFVDSDNKLLLSAGTELQLAEKALLLASDITKDNWWSRAWTFQENYRGGTRMQLLIGHHESLEPQKQRYRVFGGIPGELCISSVAFSMAVTRLCLALRELTELSPEDLGHVDCVLRAAGRYVIMLNDSSSMTPIVVADIEARGLSNPWDRLAIVANCCQYPVRLDGGALSRQGHSLSLSILAMCLLNGEIFDDGEDDIVSQPVAKLTASKLLESLMFRQFNAPEDDFRRLTFNKGCRLADVELTMYGIGARGHLWKLGRIINTADFPRESPWIKEPRGRLALDQRKCLLGLVFHLKGLGHKPLADRIDEYLKTDADAAGQEYSSFTDMYLHHMAAELATAVQKKQKLRLGCIRVLDDERSPYRAIFFWSGQGGNEAHDFAFTSMRQSHPGSQTHDANDIDCHVSLRVTIENPQGGGVPELRICNWLRGICFFEDCPLTQVILPWPQSLLS